MKIKFWYKWKRISKKEAEKIWGVEKLAERIKEAKISFREDPEREISWMDGLIITFE